MHTANNKFIESFESFTILQVAYDVRFVIHVERALHGFITRRSNHCDHCDHYNFRPMPAIKRKIIHELCVHYGCTSLSHGTEPERFVRVTLDSPR